MRAGVAEWQTRTFKGRVGDRVGSSPTTSTKQKGLRATPHSLFLLPYPKIYPKKCKNSCKNLIEKSVESIKKNCPVNWTNCY